MTIAVPATGQSASAGVKPQAPAGPDTGQENQARPDEKDVWHAYELAQQHYEMDLQLFSVRPTLVTCCLPPLFYRCMGLHWQAFLTD